MNRRGFLARLFAAPIVALALLKAPVVEEPNPFGVPFEWDSAFADDVAHRYLEPAMKAMLDDADTRCAAWAYNSMHT